MGEVNQDSGGGGKKGGKPKAKKMSTKIDMTPLVDLAFLLLTFFMLTTTFNKPRAMEIVMPEKADDKEKQMELFDQDVLNIIMLPDNKIAWYVGLKDPVLIETDYSADGVRKLLNTKNRENKDNDRFMVLMKPHPKSNYKNLVDMYDEMNITDVKRYAQADLTPQEKELVKEKYGI